MRGRRKRFSKTVWLSALAMCLVCVVPALLAAGGALAVTGAIMTGGGVWLAARAGVAAATLVALTLFAVRKVRDRSSC